MVKFYETSFSYDYSFPAVALAYFLRYPNPYSTHVLSSDVIDRHYDPATQQLTTTRLHLKKSKLPPAVLKLLPRNLVGAGASGDSQSYILETSTVDVKEGWMKAQSTNLEWTGVLSVIERQSFFRPPTSEGAAGSERTDVNSSVMMVSRLGQRGGGFLRSWSTSSIQKSIEHLGLNRARRSQPNAKEGMKVVLERLRGGGLTAVFEGMRRDRERARD
jgi:4-amino-4-deoxychorismate lyase